MNNYNNNNNNNNYNNNYNNNFQNKYIKIWLFSILVLSCIFICIQIYLNNFHDYIDKENIIDYKLLSKITPKYPPPLYNFMD